MVYLDKDSKRQVHYDTIVSQVIDHSPAATVQYLKLLVDKVPDHIKTLHFWQDAGNHFRSYQTLFWQTVEVLDMHKHLHTVFVHTDCEEHGKGAVDGHFGTCDRWKNEASMQQVLATASDLVGAYKRGGDRAMVIDPEGPKYHAHLLEPVKPKALRQSTI